MKLFLLTFLILTSSFIFSQQEVAKSAVGYKVRKWKQLDAIALDNGKLLSWEQHGKTSFIRLYKEDLKIERSFSINETKSYLKSETTRLLNFQGNFYIVYDGKVEDKKHSLYAQKINVEEKTIDNNKIKIGEFETNPLVKGFFTVEAQNERRVLISYHQKITTDYHQKIYVNLLDEKLNSVNERVYEFEHKGRLFRKVQYLMLPTNDIIVYGELFIDSKSAFSDESKSNDLAKYKLIKLSVFKDKDVIKDLTLENYIISDLFLKLSDSRVLVSGFYSDYSNTHNKGFFKAEMDVNLAVTEDFKKLDFTEEFSNKVHNEIFKAREGYLLQAKGASYLLENKIKAKIKGRGGLYSFNIIDIAQTNTTTNFIIGLNYKYSSKEASFDKVNNSLMTDQRNNYLESDVIYFKTDFEKITNFQQLPRFNVTKSSLGYRRPSVIHSTNKGNEYLAFLEVGKYSLYEKIKDDYTFTNLVTIDYQLEYKKRGDNIVFDSISKSLFSNINEDKRIRIVKIN